MRRAGKPPAHPKAAPTQIGDDPSRLPAWLTSDTAMLLLLGGLTLFYFRSLLLAEPNSILSSFQPNISDIRYQFYYWRKLGFEALARGELPLWNPYLYSGTPFIAGMQSAIFYPLNVIYLVLPVGTAINVSIILHLFLAGAFTYLLARVYGLGPLPSAFAGVTFMFSGPYVLNIYPGHLSNLNTIPWTPLLLVWVELSLRRRPLRYALLGACTLGLQLLAGHAQYVFYGGLAVMVRYLVHLARHLRSEERATHLRRAAVSFGVLFGMGALLPALQLLPAFEFVQHSMRRQATLEFVGSFSVTFENLLLFLTPSLFGSNLTEGYWGAYFIWEMCGYLGILPLVLAGWAVREERSPHYRFCLGMAGLSLLLALGKSTPFFYVMYYLVPGYRLFRGSSKFLFLGALFLSLAGGFGFRLLTERLGTISRRTWRAGFAVLLLVLLAGTVGVSLLYLRYGRHPAAWRQVVKATIESGVRGPLEIYERDPRFYETAYRETSETSWRFLVVLAGCLVLLALRGRLRWRHLWGGLALLFLLLDLWSFSSRYLLVYPERLSLWEPEVVDFFARDKEPFRISYIHNPHLIDVNTGMAYGISNVGGYDALVQRRYHRFINVNDGRMIDEIRLTLRVNRITKFARMLNLKYVMIDSDAERPQGLEEVLRTPKRVIYKNPKYLPRVWNVADGKVLSEERAIVAAMAKESFEPRSFAILEEPPDQPAGAKPPGADEAPPRIAASGLNWVRIETSQPRYALLVLSDPWFPGWKVYVNGRESKLLRANYVMRAVVTPPGESVVEFRYEPLSFRLGVLISLGAMVLVAALLSWEARREGRRQRSPALVREGKGAPQGARG
ncbi:MAG: YfhO family protein [Candidatus Tectomicrobia bacterium]|nr:YfhO family protein [Candidatus Tectomicrobia bacterium]